MSDEVKPATIPMSVFDAFVDLAKKNGPTLAPALVAPEDSAVKPGIKTTEFWLNLLAIIGGVALQFMPETSTAGHIVGGIMAVLASFHYTQSRVAVKTA
jgi:hypothetical protein